VLLVSRLVSVTPVSPAMDTLLSQSGSFVTAFSEGGRPTIVQPSKGGSVGVGIVEGVGVGGF